MQSIIKGVVVKEVSVGVFQKKDTGEAIEYGNIVQNGGLVDVKWKLPKHLREQAEKEIKAGDTIDLVMDLKFVNGKIEFDCVSGYKIK